MCFCLQWRVRSFGGWSTETLDWNGLVMFRQNLVRWSALTSKHHRDTFRMNIRPTYWAHVLLKHFTTKFSKRMFSRNPPRCRMTYSIRWNPTRGAVNHWREATFETELAIAVQNEQNFQSSNFSKSLRWITSAQNRWVAPKTPRCTQSILLNVTAPTENNDFYQLDNINQFVQCHKV